MGARVEPRPTILFLTSRQTATLFLDPESSTDASCPSSRAKLGTLTNPLQ